MIHLKWDICLGRILKVKVFSHRRQICKNFVNIPENNYFLMEKGKLTQAVKHKILNSDFSFVKMVFKSVYMI